MNEVLIPRVGIRYMKPYQEITLCHRSESVLENLQLIYWCTNSLNIIVTEGTQCWLIVLVYLYTYVHPSFVPCSKVVPCISRWSIHKLIFAMYLHLANHISRLEIAATICAYVAVRVFGLLLLCIRPTWIGSCFCNTCVYSFL